MKSMTGYGKGTAEIDKRAITVEMKSVNNRFLEINCRMPKIFCALEDGLKKLIGASLKRGAVDVYINYEDKSESANVLNLDKALAARYAENAKLLSKELKIKNGLDAGFIMRQDGVLKTEYHPADEDTLKKLLTEALETAISKINAMRENEGQSLYAELKKLGGLLESEVKKISGFAASCAEAYREKVSARMSEILKDIPLDENKILTEAAYLADRSDITEELARLKSHLEQYNKLLESDEAGKKLDFLTQELNREVNTIGSKTTDIKITALVMESKAVIEKIKEQARNIE